MYDKIARGDVAHVVSAELKNWPANRQNGHDKDTPVIRGVLLKFSFTNASALPVPAQAAILILQFSDLLSQRLPSLWHGEGVVSRDKVWYYS